jgi:hypothetical protein
MFIVTIFEQMGGEYSNIFDLSTYMSTESFLTKDKTQHNVYNHKNTAIPYKI